MNEKLEILGFTKDEVKKLIKGERIDIFQQKETPSFSFYVEDDFLKVERKIGDKLIHMGIMKIQ